MSTIFSKIAAGEIPSYKCAESDKFYAFLDIDPVTKGHTLVVPRREVDYIFDMDDDDLLPMNSEADVDFKHHVKLSEEEFKEIAEKIRKEFK